VALRRALQLLVSDHAVIDARWGISPAGVFFDRSTANQEDKLKKTLFVIVALLVAMAAVASEDWRGAQRLSGVITDHKTGAPVAGAKIKLRIGKGSHGGPDVVTDKNGKFAVLGLAAAAWDLDIEAPGYVAKQIGPVALMIGQTLPTMKIELEPQAAAEPSAAAEPAHEEVKIGGTAVSKEVADAVEAGNNFLQAGKFKEAVTEFEKAYPTLSSNVSLKLALARAYYGAGDLKKAIVLLDEVYKADPSNAQTATLLANMLLEDGQLEAGKKIIDSLPAGSVDINSLLNAGILLLNKKQSAAAMEYFTKAISIAPTRWEGYYYRGRAYIESGKKKMSKPDFEKVIELAPADTPEVKEVKEYLEYLKTAK
jgi:tetratricopeptide (TPR) repeat protein